MPPPRPRPLRAKRGRRQQRAESGHASVGQRQAGERTRRKSRASMNKQALSSSRYRPPLLGQEKNTVRCARATRGICGRFPIFRRFPTALPCATFTLPLACINPFSFALLPTAYTLPPSHHIFLHKHRMHLSLSTPCFNWELLGAQVLPRRGSDLAGGSRGKKRAEGRVAAYYIHSLLYRTLICSDVTKSTRTFLHSTLAQFLQHE